jgi:hypothetical protein
MLKPIIKFLLIFTLSYIGLLWIALSLEDAYAQGYRSVGRLLYENYGSEGYLQFFPEEDKSSGYKLNNKIVLFNKLQIVNARQSGQATIRGAELFVSSWYNGLLPSIIFASLLFASPIPWKRLFIALPIGLLLLHFFLFFKLYIAIAHEFLQQEWLAISPGKPGMIRVLYEVFVANIETTIITPVFIWIIVAFRKKDWETIVNTR